ncbi:MAG: LPS export ABC transporter permease LptF [Pseudomonadales bacterium]|nr:LPS export ABC transporter permease LptF [Pseudomonadales bacterium]
MIIFRYLSRQIFQVMAAVTLILLLIAFITRFLQYLSNVVEGRLSSDVLFLLMLYRLPDFMLVILPFALFLGILLAYGRMYAENEMSVLHACGYSMRKLLTASLLCSSMVAAGVALFSLQLAPWGLQNTERLGQSQDELTELDLIMPGQFQNFDNDLRTTYAESIVVGNEGRQLNNPFVAVRTDSAEGTSQLRIMVAESARPIVEPNSGRRFMLLENGYFYDGIPGQADYQITQFETQGLLLPERAELEPVLREKALPTLALWQSTDAPARAELQWRISVILLIPILTLIAVPLSKVEPRQGRFSKLVPATAIYAFYYIMLQLALAWVEDGIISPVIGLWWVHLLFLTLALLLYRQPWRKTGRIKRASTLMGSV